MGGMGTGLGLYLPLAIYLAVIAASVRAVFANGDYALYLLLFLIPLQTTRYRLEAFPFGSEIIDMLWMSICLGLIVRHGMSAFPKSPIYPYLIALSLITYFCLWLGSFYLPTDLPIRLSDPRFSDWKNYMVMPMVAIVVAGTAKTVTAMKRVLLVILVATAVVDWSFFRSTNGRDFSHFAYDLRDAGVIGYAGVNGFAAFIAMSVVFFATLLFCYRARIFRLVALALLGFSIYCLLFAFSRGAYFATLAGLAFVAVFCQKKLLIGIAALVICWQMVLPQAVQERINMTYGGSENTLEPSAADRVTLWEDAMNLYKANPVLGTGYDTYQFMHRVAEYGDTHNYYVKVMVETGTVGLLTLVAVLMRMAFLGLQLYFKTGDSFLKGIGLGFFGMMVCALVANFFGDRWTYMQVDGFIWVVLGCVIRGSELAGESDLANGSEAPARNAEGPQAEESLPEACPYVMTQEVRVRSVRQDQLYV